MNEKSARELLEKQKINKNLTIIQIGSKPNRPKKKGNLSKIVGKGIIKSNPQLKDAVQKKGKKKV